MTPVMNPGPPNRGASVFCALIAGFLVGAAAVAGSTARAEKTERKAPPLPAAKVNWAQCVRGPRQVLVFGRAAEATERANNLLLQGWRVVPGSVAIAASTDGGAAMLALEQPKRGTP